MTLFTAKLILSLNIPFNFLLQYPKSRGVGNERFRKGLLSNKKTFECFSEISTQDPILSSNEKCKLEVVHGFRRVFSAVYSSHLHRYAAGKNLNEGTTAVL